LLGIVSWTIIGGCVVTALIQRIMGPEMSNSLVRSAGVVPEWLLGREARPMEFDSVPTWLTPLTGIFVHNGMALHILAGGLWLALFGPRLERTFGRVRYIALLVTCAYATAIFGALALPLSGPVVGVSGLGVAVLGASIVIRSKAMLRVGVDYGLPGWIMPLPANFLAVIFLVLDLALTFDDMRQHARWDTAYAGHLSGILFGIAAAALLKPPSVALFDSDRPWPSSAELEDMVRDNNADANERTRKYAMAWRDGQMANRWLAFLVCLIVIVIIGAALARVLHL
jgi:membrane associated rhomboid family serine protease